MAMLELDGLTRRFGDLVAVDRLSWQAAAGRLVALLGANGAGKTTTLNMLTTQLAPSAGTARVAGLDIAADVMAVRRRIGYVPEHGALYEGLTAREYLELAGLLHDLDPAVALGRAERLLAHFELGDVLDDRLASFSKGMRRKVLVTAALLHDPPVLLLDEPMDGLDVASQRRLADLLRQLAAGGKTVVYSSHVLQQVEEICEDLVLIHEGRLLWSGEVAALRDEQDGRSLTDVFLDMTHGAGPATTTWADLLGDGA
ncbi:ATP-binding cassette domain-containing protein [bacterium]|nr:ATP-binding cassette domain-containing protein [bacterium]